MEYPIIKRQVLKSACHAIELAFVFNNTDDDAYAGTNLDETSVERTHTAWANFAKTGNPSIDDADWQVYDSSDRNTMMIELDGWKIESNPDSRQREIVEEILGPLYR